jgi:hypothetical protein
MVSEAVAFFGRKKATCNIYVKAGILFRFQTISPSPYFTGPVFLQELPGLSAEFCSFQSSFF